MPFASSSLGAEQPLITSELLGYGRDPLTPIEDSGDRGGDVAVPINAAAFGFWLKAAFGAADHHRHRALDTRVPLRRLDAVREPLKKEGAQG